MQQPAASAAQVLGRYLLYGEIASGGMASVHFGRMNGTAGFARTVAIKRLHPQHAKDPEFVSMFLDEARLAARVRHPNVVPMLDVVASSHEIFLVMEYVQGESLARLLRLVRAMTSPADTRILATVMAGVLHGLHAAHEATNEQGEPLDIVHRDVSPQNVLVGVDGVPRVLDFGVAKAVGRLQTTREGQVKGKLAYMAPEQLHGAPLTRQTDVYAAAVVTWEALTGQRLFQADNEGAVVTAILQAPLRAPSAVSPHVSPAFDRVVMRGLARDNTHRYATAREMALDLERCVGIVSASAIGEWVESLARDDLLKRAARVAEIESVSYSGRRPASLPGTEELPTILTGRAPTFGPVSTPPESPADVSAMALGPGPIVADAPRPSSRHSFLWVTGGVAIVACIALGLVAFLQGRPGQAAQQPATLAPSSAATAPPLETVEPPVEATPPSPPDPVASSAKPPQARTAAAVTATPAATARRSPGAAARPPATNDCDPPFTIDERGHKHYKPACLQ